MAAERNTDSSLRSSVGRRASGLYSYAQRSVDRVVPPSSRQHAYDTVSDFAAARPILFSFIASQLALSFFPLLLFVAFALSTVAFALGAAVLFALFWIALAFMLLVPALLVTSSIAVLVWAWAVGSFLVARWLYAHAPVGVRGGVRVDAPAAGKAVSLEKGDKGVDGKVEDVNHE